MYLTIKLKDGEYIGIENLKLIKQHKTKYIDAVDIVDFSDFSLCDAQYIPIGREQRDYFLDLLSNNMQYYGPLVLKNYPAFYRAYLDMLEYEDNNFGFDSAPQNYIREFKTISNELLLEATKLESHLKLPGLALTFQMVRSSHARSNN